MRNASSTIRAELHGILVFLGVIWAVFFSSLAFPSLDTFGVTPRLLVRMTQLESPDFVLAKVLHSPLSLSQ